MFSNFSPSSSTESSHSAFSINRTSSGSLFDTQVSFGLRRSNESFNIGTKSSYSKRNRVGNDEGKDFFNFKLNGRSRVRIGVTNQEFLFGPRLEIQLEKKGSSERLRRTAIGGGTAAFDRRLSRGTYTLRVSSNGESVSYRLTYRKNSVDDFDLFN